MKTRITISLLLVVFTGNVFAQSALNEFIVEVDNNNQSQQSFYNRCKDPDGNLTGTIVFSTTIPDLTFRMPDNPRRLISVSPFKDNCYVICVKPTDQKNIVGGTFQYSIEITGNGFKTLPAFVVRDIVAGDPKYFKINPKQNIVEITCYDKDYKPLDGAKIRIQGEGREERTNNFGVCKLELSSSKPENITISHYKYTDTYTVYAYPNDKKSVYFKKLAPVKTIELPLPRTNMPKLWKILTK